MDVTQHFQSQINGSIGTPTKLFYMVESPSDVKGKVAVDLLSVPNAPVINIDGVEFVRMEDSIPRFRSV